MSGELKDRAKLHRFVGRNVLELSCPRAEVIGLSAGTQALDLQDVFLAQSDMGSLWQLPQTMPHHIQIEFRRPQSGQQRCLLTARELIEGSAPERAVLELRTHDNLATIPSGLWGLGVSFSLSLGDVLDTRTRISLLRIIMGATLEVERKDGTILRRSLYTLSTVLHAAIEKVFSSVLDAKEALRQRAPGSELDRAGIVAELTRYEYRLTMLNPQGILAIVNAIEKERSDAGRYLNSLAFSRGSETYEAALAYWREATPQLIAARFSVEEMASCGLLDLLAEPGYIELQTLYFVDGDIVSVKGLPDTVSLELRLDDGASQMSKYAIVEVQDNELTWDPIGGHISEADYEGFVNFYSGAPGERGQLADQILDFFADRHEVARTQGLRDFIVEVLTYDPLPDWFAKGCRVTRDGIETDREVAALAPAAAVLDQVAPGQFAPRLLARWLAKGGMRTSHRDWARIQTITQGTQEWATLKAIDEMLQNDSRFEGILRTSFAQVTRVDGTPLYVGFEPEKDGRMAALIVVVFETGAHWAPFMDALDRSDTALGLEIAQQALNIAGRPRAVQ